MDESNPAMEAAQDNTPVDRRELLEAGLEAAEKGEPIESVVRDAAGRFAKPQQQPETQAEQETEKSSRNLAKGRPEIAGIRLAARRTNARWR